MDSGTLEEDDDDDNDDDDEEDDDDEDDDTLLSFSVATAGETTGLPENGEVCTNSNQAGDADDWYWW